MFRSLSHTLISLSLSTLSHDAPSPPRRTEWLNLKAAVGQLWYAGMSGWVTEYLISRLVHKDMMHKTSDLAQVRPHAPTRWANG
jgi:hypothetical protein